MQFLKKWISPLTECCTYSRMAVYIGLVCWIVLWSAALIFALLARQPQFFIQAQQQFSGAVETGPACFASCICAAALCDITQRSHQ